MSMNFQFGISQSFPCNYLPDEHERLLVATDVRLHNQEHYTWLMTQGFRRSGEQIYRPHCEHCSACQSLRVLVDNFSPSKSQKRNLTKNASLVIKISEQQKASYYPLFEHYINSLHQDGSMYPATPNQYESFITSEITKQLFIEVWLDEILISVAVTDNLNDALSAVYTFYHPEYRSYGLGTFSILSQVATAKEMGKPYLYLGYQIDDCQKMNYKNRFFPHQRLTNNSWKTVNK